jgi:hypothetical protein
MTTGSMLYLLMCLAMFGAFSATLAYYSNEKRKPSAGMQPAASARPVSAGNTGSQPVA